MTAPDSHAPESDARQATYTRWVLAGWLSGAAAIAYVCRNCLAVAESTIREDLNLSEDQMGFIMGAFFWSYALGQIPGGALGERFGSRRALPAFSCVFSAALAVWGIAWHAATLLVSRVAMGLAQAGLFPCSAMSMTRWFPKTERGTMSGLLAASMQVGAVIAAPLTGLLLETMSWRLVFVLFALPGLIWAFGFALWFRERPEEHPSVNDAERKRIIQGRDDSGTGPTTSKERTPWLRLLTSRAVIFICSQQFFRAAGYAWFATWFATYLQESHGVSRAASGWLTAIPLIGSLTGALSAGGLSDWILRRTGSYTLSRKALAAGCLSACAALVFAAYFVADPLWATSIIGAGAFFAACAGPCSYATTMDIGGRHVTPVFATMNMVGNFGAALFPIIVPPFRRMIQSNHAVLELFGGNSWNAVLVLFGGIYVLAALCWLMVPMQGSAHTKASTTWEGEAPAEPGDHG